MQVTRRTWLLYSWTFIWHQCVQCDPFRRVVLLACDLDAHFTSSTRSDWNQVDLVSEYVYIFCWKSTSTWLAKTLQYIYLIRWLGITSMLTRRMLDGTDIISDSIELIILFLLTVPFLRNREISSRSDSKQKWMSRRIQGVFLYEIVRKNMPIAEEGLIMSQLYGMHHFNWLMILSSANWNVWSGISKHGTAIVDSG